MNTGVLAHDVVVVGAGLGGLATAVAARQAGRSVVVLERANGPSEVDTGITLWSFAVRTLNLLGVENMTCLGAPLERLMSYSASGALLSDVDLRPSSRCVGAPSFDVHRARLQQALYEVLGQGVVRHGARCVGIRDEKSAAIAELATGPDISGRVLVGADGARSVVRPHVAGDVPDRTSAFGVWRGVLDVDERVIPAGVHLRVYGPGGLFGAARLDDLRVRWYAGARLPPGTQGSWSELARRFGGWCEPIPSMVDASRDRRLLFNDTPRTRPIQRWVRGRVALVGDAAHAAIPTLGVSGGLALADGLALGSTLKNGVDRSSLEAYARHRQPVGRRIQREAQAFSFVLAPRRSRLVRARNRLLCPPFDVLQRKGTSHLSRGGEASIAAELPREISPRGVFGSPPQRLR